MHALVTGGAGFIGSNLTHRLIAEGARVRVLDDLSTGRRANLDGLDVELLTADIRDPGALERATDGVEVVYHLAALPSVARSIVDPVASHAVNATGTLMVLQAARSAGVRRVVYASSSSVYGDTEELPKHENMPARTLSPYAVSKLAGEAYCRAFARSFGLQTVALRFFNIFGPRQDPASEYAAVIPRFIARIVDGEAPEIFGDGMQSRDFTYVANAVEACVLAGASGPEAVGEAVNVGCGDRITLLDLVALLGELLGAVVEPRFGPPREGDVRHSQAAIDKAGRLIGYRPMVSLRDGLDATVRWFTTSLGTTAARA